VIKSWCIPKVTTRFIAKMEDVLAVYQRPYDPRYPLICLDEKGKELQSTRPGQEPLPAQPGKRAAQSVRPDYAYVREGSANLLLMCEPLRGWRKVVVSQDRVALHPGAWFLVEYGRTGTLGFGTAMPGPPFCQ
jgi:hypothetical protein